MNEGFANLKIVYSERKNLLLKSNNRPTFDDVITAIHKKNIVAITKNKNYKEQYFIYVTLAQRKHLCAVPCKVVEGKYLVLITVFEDRKATRKYSNNFEENQNDQKN